MIAFVSSFVATFLFLVPAFVYARRRPQGTPLTWGEALIAATYAFFLMWWVYGVVPHWWLTWADSELGWRADKIFLGPGKVLEVFPFTITGVVVRDLIVVGIYVFFLGLQIAAWALWQGRGEKQPEIETSEYGRPLVREG